MRFMEVVLDMRKISNSSHNLGSVAENIIHRYFSNHNPIYFKSLKICDCRPYDILTIICTQKVPLHGILEPRLANSEWHIANSSKRKFL